MLVKLLLASRKGLRIRESAWDLVMKMANLNKKAPPDMLLRISFSFFIMNERLFFTT
jgi:hypothetical protein